MAHSLSSKKRVRQNDKRQAINTARKSRLKTQTRKFTDAVAAKDLAAAEKELVTLSKTLDHVAARGTIHCNTASRRKSRMQQRLNALKASS